MLTHFSIAFLDDEMNKCAITKICPSGKQNVWQEFVETKVLGFSVHCCPHVCIDYAVASHKIITEKHEKCFSTICSGFSNPTVAEKLLLLDSSRNIKFSIGWVNYFYVEKKIMKPKFLLI